MAWYPEARRAPLSVALSTSRPHTPVRLTLHTAVSNSANLYGSGPDASGTYAHFYVAQDGTVWQYVDTAQAARADLEGNFGSISVETWDGRQHVEWTAAQVAALGRLFAWVTATHRTVPHRIATPSDTRGLAWHRLGIAGNFGSYSATDRKTWSRAQTGLKWSNARGKECPWGKRIDQIGDIYSRASHPAQATTETTTIEERMHMYLVRRKSDGAHYLVTPGAMRHIGTVGEVQALLALGLTIRDLDAQQTYDLAAAMNLQSAAVRLTTEATKGWKL